MPAIVVLDACVLYPIGIRDILLDLANELDLFRPRWSADILDEMARNLVKSGRCDEERAARLRAALNSVFPEADVDSYTHLIPLMGNHPKDRHVLAAAVAAEADIIVTDNLKDFPAKVCAVHGVRVMNADTFLERCHELHPQVGQVVRGVVARYGRHGRGGSYDEFVDRLFLSAPKFTAKLIETDRTRT